MKEDEEVDTEATIEEDQEITDEVVEESEETVEEYDIEEDVDALFGGEELSEEFKEKARTIFEGSSWSKSQRNPRGLEEASVCCQNY